MRPAATLRAGVGILEASAPHELVRTFSGRRDDPLVRDALRLLGTRHALESGLLASSSSLRLRRVLTGVDLLHVASMVGVAALVPRYRRPAATSAVVSLALLAAQHTLDRQPDVAS